MAQVPSESAQESATKYQQSIRRSCPTQRKPAQGFHTHTPSKRRVVTTADPIQEVLVPASDGTEDPASPRNLVQETYKPRGDNIILATQPKCGTTWLKALAFAITNRSRYSFTDHPLLTGHPQHIVPFIEIPGLGTDHADIETLPSPRLLATHMPMSMLPPDTSSRGCRIVYLCRDPKDALVSRLHYENRVVKGCNLSMENASSMFCEGFSPYGPFWDHCDEYWKESLAGAEPAIWQGFVAAIPKLQR